MKIVIGRLINMLAVLILLFGHIFSVNAISIKPSKTDKSLKFYKLDLVDDENSFLEDEEEEEEDDFSHNYFVSPGFQSFESLEKQIKKSSQQNFYIQKSHLTTSIPRWLEIRHILI